MPLSAKGKKVMASMMKTYKNAKQAKSVFYASRNAGKITGVDKSKNPKQTKKTNPIFSIAGKKGQQKKKLVKTMKKR